MPPKTRIAGTILLLTEITVEMYDDYTAICESDTLACSPNGLESVGKSCYLVTMSAIM